MSMELILKQTQVTIPQAIENIQYLRKELKDQLDYYEGIIVTPDTMKSAKADKANLNKLKTAIDNQRKEVKKQVLGLYEPLETECKELLGMIDRPIEAIDKQLKAFDEQKKAEKYAALVEFFGQISPPPFVKLEDVLNPKWANATVKLETLKSEMSGAVQAIVDDYAEIKKLYADSPMLTAIVQKFETMRDKGAALAYAAEIERKEQARREREAAEKARLEAEQTQPGPKPEPIPVQKSFTAQTDTVVKTVEQPELVGTVTFSVTGTKSQIIALRDFMRHNNIAFTVIK